MPPNSSVLGKAALGVALVIGGYAVILGALLAPDLQRFALYAHKFNTLFLHDVNDPEQFGFAENQVTPFNIQTPDGETLYAWHVLPIDVYAAQEQLLRGEDRPQGPAENFTGTTPFYLLTASDPSPARVVISFHGNAGHISQAWRPDTFRYLTAQPNTHVITIDYRGFGHSTGSPTEAGLITDGTALVNWVLNVAKIPPERIIILGQSLGTAVASAVGLQFADPANQLLPPESREAFEGSRPTSFAGIILVAPFYSVPSLLLTYRIGGFLPILLPLRPFPYFAGLFTSQVVDKWPTGERLRAYYQVLSQSAEIGTRGQTSGRNMGTLQLIHAVNDRDISYHQTEMICRSMLGETECIDGSKGPAVLRAEIKDRPNVRFEILGYGGHNRLITFAPVAVAVVRAFQDIFPPNQQS